jgi:hypothetical protein
MKQRVCPACGKQISSKGLRIEPIASAPTRFGLTWPRYYCPHCGVQLRSSSRSLLGAFVLFAAGTGLLITQLALPTSAGEVTNVLGSTLLLAAFICAYWFHRWEIAGDTSA